MSRQFSSVDVPRPLAMFCTLFRLKIPDRARNAAPLFRALRIWTEMGDISETESFGEARLFISSVASNKCPRRPQKGNRRAYTQYFASSRDPLR
jgi:hypothetical protein